MDEPAPVTAVVVTYNRKDMLASCLHSLLSQSLAPASIIVIDNASDDGTETLFKGEESQFGSRTEYHRLPRNMGGAGGFKEGLRLCLDGQGEWYWIMDDDVMPAPDALEQLLKAKVYLESQSIEPSYLASCVYGGEGEVMNVPSISEHVAHNGYPDWSEYLPQGLVRITSATFVSILLSAKAVRDLGLPIGDYFLWGDDIEYTSRLTAFWGPAYLCGNSTVQHLRKDPRPIELATERDPRRAANHRRRIRNDLVNTWYYRGAGKATKRIARRIVEGMRVLASRDNLKVQKLKAIGGGIADFLLHSFELEDLGKLDRHDMKRY